MKIVIVGPGAMGCLLAGCLARRRAPPAAPDELWLLDRRPARAAVIRRRGIRIEDRGRTVTAFVRITTRPRDIGPADVVFLCTKSYDVARVLPRIGPLIGRRTLVVAIQNGAGHLERIAARVGARRVLCAVTEHGSTLLGPGHVRHAGHGRTFVAPLLPSRREAARRVASLLRSADWDGRSRSNAAAVVWRKLVVNVAINPVTALSGVRNGRVPETPSLWRVARAAAAEAARVARRMGIRPALRNPAAAVRLVCRKTAANVSSMLQDLRAGRPTEIAAIAGTVVAEGRRRGVPTPVTASLFARVRALEKKKGKSPGEVTGPTTPRETEGNL